MLVFFFSYPSYWVFLSFVSDWLCFYAEDAAIVLPRRAEVFSGPASLLAVSASEKAPGWVWLGIRRADIFFSLFSDHTFFSFSHSFASPPISLPLPSFSFILFPLALPVCLPQLLSLVHPPHTSYLFALPVCVHMCVKFTGLRAQWPCTRRRVWSALCICYRGFVGRSTPLHREQEWSEEEQRGERNRENAISESEKHLGKEGKPRLGRDVGNKVWHREAKMNWSEPN